MNAAIKAKPREWQKMNTIKRMKAVREQQDSFNPYLSNQRDMLEKFDFHLSPLSARSFSLQTHFDCRKIGQSGQRCGN
jgi:hypothetical protein